MEIKGAPGRVRAYKGDEQKMRSGEDVGRLPPKEMTLWNVLDLSDRRFYPLLESLFGIDFDILTKKMAGNEKQAALFFRSERKLPPLTILAVDPTMNEVYSVTNAKPSGKPSCRVSKKGDKIEVPFTVIAAVSRDQGNRIRDNVGVDFIYNISITQTEVDEHIAKANADAKATDSSGDAAGEPENKKGKKKDKVSVPLDGSATPS